MLVRTCGNDEPAAIEVLPDGALGEAFPLPDRPVSLSAADRQLLVAVGGSDTDGALLYVDRKGHTRQLGRGITGATWVTGQSAVDAAPSAEAAPQPSTQPVPEATADASPPSGTCTYSPRATPAPARDVAPPSAEASDLPTTATIVTNRGEIRLTLLGDVAPCTVHNLAHLARAGFYDKTQCHRLTTQGIYVVQCGDPTGKGDGGPGYVFRDENLAGATYAKGTVAMANSGPGTNGSQFFFAYDDFPLDPNYTPFARITAGLDVLLEVAGGGSEPAVDGRPVKPLEILSIRLGS
jgi:peptidyl-prolyl cis-trans isomerase B (cyclophilin B)